MTWWPSVKRGLYCELDPLLWCTYRVELNLHGAVHCNPSSSQCRCFAGCFSGLCQTVITIPTELLKIRLQLQTATPGMPGYVGPIRLLRQVLYREGLTGADTAATVLETAAASAAVRLTRVAAAQKSEVGKV